MASPLFDALQLQHAKNLGDSVASVSTDGKRWSHDQRNYHLNEAGRRLLRMYASRALSMLSLGIEPKFEMMFLNAFIVDASATALTANVKSLTSWDATNTVLEVLEAYNATDSLIVKRIPENKRYQTSAGGNSYLTASATNQFFILDAGNFRLLDGATNSADTIALRFIKTYVDLTDGNTTDIIIPSPFFGQLLKMALVVADEEVANSEHLQRAQLNETVLRQEIATG